MNNDAFRKQARKIWNRLSKADRKEVLKYRQVWNPGSDELFELESGLKWDKLLPSTQDKLVGVDLSMILGREVSPETE
jgi:hypothetical protein